MESKVVPTCREISDAQIQIPISCICIDMLPFPEETF